MKKIQVDPYSPGRPPLGKVAAWVVPSVAIVWAIADIAGASALATGGVLAVGLIILLASMWLAYRNWQTTTELPAMLRKNLRSLLQTELPPGSLITKGHGYGSFLKPGPATRVIIKASGLPPMEGETSKRVVRIVSDLCQLPYVLDNKKSVPGKRIVLSRKPKENKNTTPRERIVSIIQEGANDIFPKESPKLTCVWDQEKPDEDYLLEVVITGVNGMELSLPGKRNQILTKLRSRLPKGNFVSDVDPGEDQIRFSRSKPLPNVVVPTKEQAPLLVSHEAYKSFSVPLGVGDNSEQAVWMPRRDAHLLIIGATGKGKTICEHGVIQRLAQAGWRTWLIDGKRVEFMGYENYPNVEFLAQDIDQQIRLVKLAHDTMMARYHLIQTRQVQVADLDPIVLVIDEVTSFLDFVTDRYMETKIKGQPAKHPVIKWIANIGRLGRTSKFHMVHGLQRPDANIMGGELRDNFGCRISHGKLKSKEASMMMWDNPAIGQAVPEIPGRAVSVMNGRVGLIQSTYTANPEIGADDYHAGMVEFMRPRFEVYTRKHIAEPIPIPRDDDEDSEISWNDILEADLLDSSGRSIKFDPVSSDESKAFQRAHEPIPVTPENSTLQTAESFGQGMDLFSYDPISKISYGKPLALKLAALSESIQPSETPESLPAYQNHNLNMSGDSYHLHQEDGSFMELREVSPGQSILIEAVSEEEIFVASCEADEEDSDIVYLTGYTADGEPIHLELSADTKVEAFELADA